MENELQERYRQVRARSERLCEPLVTDDYQLQAIPEVSPAKWHLAHVSWFFETFLLRPGLPAYRLFNERFEYLFNSYYYQVGSMHPRSQRGLISRPTVEEVYAYRAHVDEAMQRLLSGEMDTATSARVVLGLNHEEQHQELLLMDLKYNFSINPLRPAYRENDVGAAQSIAARAVRWIPGAAGEQAVGHHGDGFAFDNEGPRHVQLLQPHELADRLVTNGEYREFIDDGGYTRSGHWLADGWGTIRDQGWQAPLYWEQRDGQWWQMTLAGMQPLADSEPVCHLSYYEADAYASWRGLRLPSEAELETRLAAEPVAGNFLEQGALHPRAATDAGQWYGDLWQWSRSSYEPYPGFVPPAGAIGEYNGKFMCNQRVLRGGACVTPRGHVRASYRNFFYPRDRWAFTGLRLARDA
ncbi:MAG: ergothioneine biosynthesis protein EgtB [Gammaproteobacteria bacterium]|nr:ergothioneine biosynthesis protein EgtB [Gammaproteobacteria bacterium]